MGEPVPDRIEAYGLEADSIDEQQWRDPRYEKRWGHGEPEHYVLLALYREAVEALRGFDCFSPSGGDPYCLSCGRHADDNDQAQHNDGCPIARVLAKAKEMGV